MYLASIYKKICYRFIAQILPQIITYAAGLNLKIASVCAFLRFMQPLNHAIC